MPRYRQLHTKVLNSFDFNEMPDDFTRVVWLLMTLILDSEGRGIDNMQWVKSNMFPLREDVTSEQLEASFEWLEKREMIVRYTVKGRGYFYIPTFKDYQSGTKKEAASILPSPTPEQLQSNSREAPEQVGTAESASASESVLNMSDVFKTYEEEIGQLTGTISDEIKVYCEDGTSPDYFVYAFKEAARNNARSWAYAEKILKRLKKDGMKFKNNGKKSNPKKFEEIEVNGEIQFREVLA